MELKPYRIPVVWQMAGEVVIPAKSLDEAISKAKEIPLPEGHYVEDSFEVQEDFIDYEQS